MNRNRFEELQDGATPTSNELAELISLADDGWTFRELNERGHTAEFTDTGYGLEHPVVCRMGKSLLECPVERKIRASGGPPWGYGRFRVILDETGILQGWPLSGDLH